MAFDSSEKIILAIPNPGFIGEDIYDFYAQSYGKLHYVKLLDHITGKYFYVAVHQNELIMKGHMLMVVKGFVDFKITNMGYESGMGSRKTHIFQSLIEGKEKNAFIEEHPEYFI